MTEPQTGRIFISYRRADSAGYAGRVYDRLAAHFGKEAIFMDVDTIQAGLDFVDVLENAVQSCDVVVALLGRQWLNIKGEDGKRRLDNPQDFVRIEVATALDRNIRVIPVLVDGAPMPNSSQLPDNLKPLARRNAILVNHHSFHTDANRLIKQLELALKAVEVQNHSARKNVNSNYLITRQFIERISGIRFTNTLKSVFQPTRKTDGQSSIRQILVSILWLFLFVFGLSAFLEVSGFQIQNVLALFWGSIVAFGIMGIKRSWAKDALVTSSVIFGLAFNHILRVYIPLFSSFNMAETDVSLFWMRVAIILIWVYIAFQFGKRIPSIMTEAVRQRFQSNQYGIVTSAINGYMIVGSLLYYYVIADYPFQNIIIKPTDPALRDAINWLMLYMPPQLLGEPSIYFAAFIAFIVILVVLM